MIDVLFLVVTLMIPKAGIQLASVPLTLNLIILVFVLLKDVGKSFTAIQLDTWVGLLYYGFLMVAVISTLLCVGGRGIFQVAQNIVAMFSPLAIVAATRVPRDKAMRIVVAALIVVNVVGLLQYAFGISKMSVEGITYTYGQELSSKPIGYGSSSTGEANKIISTYQNGNSYAIFLALYITLALLWHPGSRRWRNLRIAGISLGLVGMLICGSRSTVLPFCIAVVYLAFQRMSSWQGYVWRRNFLIMLSLIGMAIAYVICANSDLIASFTDRIIRQTLEDSTASGRTGQWQHMLESFFAMGPIEAARFLLLGQGEPFNLLGEGLPEFICRFGIPAALMYYGALFGTSVYFLRRPQTRPLGAGMLCVVVAFCVDQSFYYPPTVMEFYLAAGIGLSFLPSYDVRGLPSERIQER